MRRGHSWRPATELGMRLGFYTSKNGGRDEYLSQAYLLPWLEWPEGSQKVLGAWTKFEGDLCGPLEMEGVLNG